MCGINAYIGPNQPLEPLVYSSALSSERGYEGAGVIEFAPVNAEYIGAWVVSDTAELVTQIEAAPEKYEILTDATPRAIRIGIQHSRWATNGKPNLNNTQPMISSDSAFAMNGILNDSFNKAVRSDLEESGVLFESNNDAETAQKYIDKRIQDGDDFLADVISAFNELDGELAIAYHNKKRPNELVVAAKGSNTAVIGTNKTETFVVSEEYYMPEGPTKTYTLLPDQFAICIAGDITVYDQDGEAVEIEWNDFTFVEKISSPYPYEWYMEKEMREHGLSAFRSIEGRIVDGHAELPELDDLEDIKAGDMSELRIVATGSSLNAAEMAQPILQSILGVPVSLFDGPDAIFEYTVPNHRSIIITASQSGSTNHTFKAAEGIMNKATPVIALLNNTDSTKLGRQADMIVQINAGKEHSVPSTKAVTSQFVSLLLTGLAIAEKRSGNVTEAHAQIMKSLESLPGIIDKHTDNLMLQADEIATRILEEEIAVTNTLVHGYPPLKGVAKEISLKIQETPRMQSKAMSSGELLHGPITLIDESNLSIVLMHPNDEEHRSVNETQLNDIEKLKVRSSKVLTMQPESMGTIDSSDYSIIVPDAPAETLPVLQAIAGQMLAYHLAIKRGENPDRPPGAAKVVAIGN